MRFTRRVAALAKTRRANFVALCERRGWTASDLAGEHGVMGWGGYSFWRGVLNGSRPFAETLARAIEERLSTDLHAGDLDKDPDAEATIEELSPLEQQIVGFVRVLAQRDRERVIALHRQLNEEVVRGAPTARTPPAAQPLSNIQPKGRRGFAMTEEAAPGKRDTRKR